MEGVAVPVVIIPRYSSFVGVNVFTTQPLLVEEFSKAQIVFFRSGMDAGASFSASFQTSQNQQDWFDDPGSPITSVATEDIHEVDLPRKWFRIRIELSGSDPAITCWAAGLLIRREEGKKG